MEIGNGDSIPSNQELTSVVIADVSDNDHTVITVINNNTEAEESVHSTSDSSTSTTVSASVSTETTNTTPVQAHTVKEEDLAVVGAVGAIIEKFSKSLDNTTKGIYEDYTRKMRHLVLSVLILGTMLLATAGGLLCFFFVNYITAGIFAFFVIFLGIYHVTTYKWMHTKLMILYYNKMLNEFRDIQSLSSFVDTIIKDTRGASQWIYLQMMLSYYRKKQLGDNDGFLDPVSRAKIDSYTRIIRLTKLPTVVQAKTQLMNYFRKGVVPEQIRDHREATKHYSPIKQALLYLLSHHAIRQDFEKPFDEIKEGELNAWIAIALKLY